MHKKLFTALALLGALAGCSSSEQGLTLLSGDAPRRVGSLLHRPQFAAAEIYDGRLAVGGLNTPHSNVLSAVLERTLAGEFGYEAGRVDWRTYPAVRPVPAKGLVKILDFARSR